MTNYTDMGEALDWDDEVSDEGGFTLLPAGTYPFEVIKLEKGRFLGSEKVAECPQATVTFNVLTDSGWAKLTDRFLLNSNWSWRYAKFFKALGFAKNPETGKMSPHWNEIEGKQGWFKIIVSKYTSKKDGTERESNDVEAYLKPEEWPDQPSAAPAAASAYTPAPAPAAAPVVQQPAYQQAAMPTPTQQPTQPQHPGWAM